ncbi:MAG: lysine--tRNA ligase, partial [Burkholderiales bacterium]
MTNPTPAVDTHTTQDENHIIAERREKLRQVRSQGVAFPNDFVPAHRAETLHQRYNSFDKPTLEGMDVDVSIAGRIRLKRVMGKASFATVQD